MKRFTTLLLAAVAGVALLSGAARAQINAQTGTTYTVLNSDCDPSGHKVVTFSNASAVAVTLPQAGASGAFKGGCSIKAVNLGVTAATDEEILELREAAESFRAPSQSETEFAAALERFLTALVQISHNRLLVAISHFLIQKHIALARQSALISSQMWDKVARKLIDERLAVVDAVAGRDAPAAASAIRIYLERGRQLLRANAATAAGEPAS